MKKFLVVCVVMTAFQFGDVLIRAEAEAAQNIAVLDLVAVRRLSMAGKSITEQFTVYRKAFQKDAEGQQKSLKAAQSELRLQRSLLSPEAMQARERKFQDEVAAAQRRFQERKKALEKSRVEALKVFETNLTEVLKKLRADKKIDVILKKRPAIIYADPSVDITGEVLKRMNARIKKIDVKNPGK